MTDMEVSSAEETFFSLQPDGEGKMRPTLSDEAGEGRTRAVCLISSYGQVEIHTDPEIVAAFLDDMTPERVDD
jgi:hypothetical protein